MTSLITGIIAKGHGVASGTGIDTRFPAGTIRMQAPFFKALGLDLDAHFKGNFIYGTLNTNIAPHTYRVIRPDYHLKNVKWTDIFPPENFFLVDLTFKHKGHDYRGLLYQPDSATKPDHFQPPSVMEIIAETVANAAYDDVITLNIDPAKIEISG